MTIEVSRRATIAGASMTFLVGAARGQNLTPVSCGTAQTITDAPIFIADKKRYFQEEGLQVAMPQFASAAFSSPTDTASTTMNWHRGCVRKFKRCTRTPSNVSGKNGTRGSSSESRRRFPLPHNRPIAMTSFCILSRANGCPTNRYGRFSNYAPWTPGNPTL